MLVQLIFARALLGTSLWLLWHYFLLVWAPMRVYTFFFNLDRVVQYRYEHNGVVNSGLFLKGAPLADHFIVEIRSSSRLFSTTKDDLFVAALLWDSIWLGALVNSSWRPDSSLLPSKLTLRPPLVFCSQHVSWEYPILPQLPKLSSWGEDWEGGEWKIYQDAGSKCRLYLRRAGGQGSDYSSWWVSIGKYGFSSSPLCSLRALCYSASLCTKLFGGCRTCMGPWHPVTFPPVINDFIISFNDA